MNIEELKKQKAEIEAKIKELERPWEKGMWLISKRRGTLVRFNYYEGGNYFSSSEFYNDLSGINSPSGWMINKFRPATEKEVIEGLKKEAIRRYTGKIVKCLHKSSDVCLFRPKFSSGEREVNWLWIRSKGMEIKIYSNGKWADIVDKITIAGYEVEDLGKEVKIGRSTVSKKSLRGFFDVTDIYGWSEINAVLADCTTDELTTLRKMVEK